MRRLLEGGAKAVINFLHVLFPRDLSSFAPHKGYCADQSRPFDEFRDMVKAFHMAGIEVWLDVVYNHTAEGDEIGPCYNLRGIDNSE